MTATATPPFAVPSSLVRATPVTPTASSKSFAWRTPFWPVVASRTSSVSWGAPSSRPAITRRTLASSSIRFVCVCSRPAVSTTTTSRAARLGRRDGVEGDRSGVGAALRADEVRAGALRPDLELLLRGGAERVRGGQHDRAAGLLEAVGELADRRRLPRAVDADDEDDRRRPIERQALLALDRDELGHDLLQPLDELLLARGLALLQALHDLDSRRDAAVGGDQRLLDPFPRLLVARIEQQLAGQRLPAGGERLA